MSDKLTVRMITPEAQLFEVPADEVILTGSRGGFAILPKRAPLAAELIPSKISIKNEGKTDQYFIASGMVEVSDNSVNILTEMAVKVGEVDKSDLESRLASLAQKIKDLPEGLVRAELAEHMAFLELALKG